MNRHTTERRRHALCCSLSVVLLVYAGCGGSGPETVTIRGQLIFEGGAIPQHCTIYFQPKEVAEGLPLRPANSKLDDKGRFTVTSFKNADGLVPGTYGVMLEYFEPTPGGDPSREDGWVRHTSQLEDLTVRSGSGTVDVHYRAP